MPRGVYIRTDYHKNLLFQARLILKGKPAWNKGKKGLHHHSDDTRKKMSLARQGYTPSKHPNWRPPWLGKKRPDIMGENNPAWKGDKVSKNALHDYFKARLIKPKKCPKCNSEWNIQLSNISGEYKRELNDWQWLCAKCHWAFDRERIMYARKNKNI